MGISMAKRPGVFANWTRRLGQVVRCRPLTRPSGYRKKNRLSSPCEHIPGLSSVFCRKLGFAIGYASHQRCETAVLVSPPPISRTSPPSKMLRGNLGCRKADIRH